MPVDRRPAASPMSGAVGGRLPMRSHAVISATKLSLPRSASRRTPNFSDESRFGLKKGCAMRCQVREVMHRPWVWEMRRCSPHDRTKCAGSTSRISVKHRECRLGVEPRMRVQRLLGNTPARRDARPQAGSARPRTPAWASGRTSEEGSFGTIWHTARECGATSWNRQEYPRY